MEVEGRCPLCHGAMPNPTKSVYWKDMILEFPYRIYFCWYHGYFVWRGKKGHQLADFSKLQKEATIKPLFPELKEKVQPTECTIVKMKCPYCGFEWEQYKETPPESWGNILYCPDCNSEIPRDKAVKKDK